MLRRLGLLLAGGLVLLAGVGLGLSRTIGGVPGAPETSCADPLPWQRADEVVGDSAAIAGTVAAASHEPDVGGGPTFLNLGNPHPDPERFDVVIYEDVRERFDVTPEDAFVGQELCVSGQIRDRDGVPQLILDAPTQLQRR